MNEKSCHFYFLISVLVLIISFINTNSDSEYLLNVKTYNYTVTKNKDVEDPPILFQKTEYLFTDEYIDIETLTYNHSVQLHLKTNNKNNHSLSETQNEITFFNTTKTNQYHRIYYNNNSPLYKFYKNFFTIFKAYIILTFLLFIVGVVFHFVNVTDYKNEKRRKVAQSIVKFVLIIILLTMIGFSIYIIMGSKDYLKKAIREQMKQSNILKIICVDDMDENYIGICQDGNGEVAKKLRVHHIDYLKNYNFFILEKYEIKNTPFYYKSWLFGGLTLLIAIFVSFLFGLSNSKIKKKIINHPDDKL
ncbi:hypothetical protein DICPUDRAFT_84105 [Dictyostelium purpureum]|uniref:Transmembrane protein n=1 Tax=Dictyostelium purpureum TaxID=5786 RepID=F1A1L4_DICPU|nr:uncharacterized protein DICPUDRAFT_84105 [Dictyostelium purpureum]EGC29919.1 hypothetical protein DICPUDRAFT_84105 [Dictyostelium purpureum]|eukprot:XP_003293560.1 hypothetical protein DICPUDRAFT_84105 [Dictyostelium purpureum]